ncbi:hypothetical protein [Salinicola aestuarinus]|uniref:hypothetical protein n=1 Tax=Salinicola aestuarinus TaxID=1949082 RepID=UPI000DA2390A|nr:hypothetical protein [Salinicola aestuarinus]
MSQHHARAAGILCRDASFRLYLDRRARAKFNADVPDGTHSDQDASEWIRRACDVTSRAELDTNPQAAATFRLIQNRFNRWKARGRRQ